MKKILFILISILSLSGCSNIDKDAISDVIFNKYKEDAIASDTYVKTGVYDVSIESEKRIEDGSTEIKVKFTILENHPSTNVKYKGSGIIIKDNNGSYKVKSYDYR